MKVTQLEQELATNFDALNTANGEAPSFEILYKLYTHAEATLHSELGVEVAMFEDLSDTLGKAQDNLIEISAQLTAKTIDDILFKMALWRRHADHIDPLDETMTGDERLGYSVFRDLARICQLDEVLTDQDRAISP